MYSSYTFSCFPSISNNFSCSPWIRHPSLSWKGLQLSRVKWNPLRYGFMYWYVLATYTMKVLIDSILDLSNPPYSLSYRSTKSCINVLTLSHWSCETIPHNTSVVRVTVPTQGLSYWYGPCTFLDAYLIPVYEHVEPHFLKATQYTSSVGPIGYQSST